LLDRLLDHAPAPWGERVLDLMTSLAQGRTEALEQHRAAATSAPPSRPLQVFCGRYEHPAYGHLDVSLDGDALVPGFHELGSRVSLRHRGHDAWDLWFSADEVSCPLVFHQDKDGAIASLSVALEEAVAPIVFARTT